MSIQYFSSRAQAQETADRLTDILGSSIKKAPPIRVEEIGGKHVIRIAPPAPDDIKTSVILFHQLKALRAHVISAKMPPASGSDPDRIEGPVEIIAVENDPAESKQAWKKAAAEAGKIAPAYSDTLDNAVAELNQKWKHKNGGENPFAQNPPGKLRVTGYGLRPEIQKWDLLKELKRNKLISLKGELRNYDAWFRVPNPDELQAAIESHGIEQPGGGSAARINSRKRGADPSQNGHAGRE